MEQSYFNEMEENLRTFRKNLDNKQVFLFGHCEATLVLADLLKREGICPEAILDNSEAKQGQVLDGIRVISPNSILEFGSDQTIVLIVTRFYEAMNSQLRKAGYRGDILKLVDYNTYAEYSLQSNTIERKLERVRFGWQKLEELKTEYINAFMVFCPFNALGDVYFAMSYLPAFMKKRKVDSVAVCVPSNSCANVVRLFGIENVCVLKQKELDAVIQAVIYTQDKNCFIAHQDRPYIIKLHNALRHKCIPLEQIYCCGVYGLKSDTEPVIPYGWKEWADLETIKKDRSVILSPYAKSVTAIRDEIWSEITDHYNNMGYEIYTNVCGDEKPLPGTRPLSAKLNEMKSIVERAGTFIGIRSGLCDIIRTADCRKIALYPDYNYSDTKWKAIDMYSIAGFENILVEDGDTWEKIIRK